MHAFYALSTWNGILLIEVTGIIIPFKLNLRLES